MGGTVSGEGGFGGGADECSSCFAMAETGACLATSAWCFKDISYCAGADACIRSSGCLQAPTEAKLISCAEALCGAEHFQIWLGYSHCPFCFCKASCPAAAELCPGAGTQGAGGAG